MTTRTAEEEEEYQRVRRAVLGDLDRALNGEPTAPPRFELPEVEIHASPQPPSDLRDAHDPEPETRVPSGITAEQMTANHDAYRQQHPGLYQGTTGVRQHADEPQRERSRYYHIDGANYRTPDLDGQPMELGEPSGVPGAQYPNEVMAQLEEDDAPAYNPPRPWTGGDTPEALGTPEVGHPSEPAWGELTPEVREAMDALLAKSPGPEQPDAFRQFEEVAARLSAPAPQSNGAPPAMSVDPEQSRAERLAAAQQKDRLVQLVQALARAGAGWASIAGNRTGTGYSEPVFAAPTFGRDMQAVLNQERADDEAARRGEMDEARLAREQNSQGLAERRLAMQEQGQAHRQGLAEDAAARQGERHEVAMGEAELERAKNDPTSPISQRTQEMVAQYAASSGLSGAGSDRQGNEQADVGFLARLSERPHNEIVNDPYLGPMLQAAMRQRQAEIRAQQRGRGGSGGGGGTSRRAVQRRENAALADLSAQEDRPPHLVERLEQHGVTEEFWDSTPPALRAGLIEDAMSNRTPNNIASERVSNERRLRDLNQEDMEVRTSQRNLSASISAITDPDVGLGGLQRIIRFRGGATQFLLNEKEQNALAALENFFAPMRNEQFGASLTDSERQAFDAAMAAWRGNDARATLQALRRVAAMLNARSRNIRRGYVEDVTNLHERRHDETRGSR